MSKSRIYALWAAYVLLIVTNVFAWSAVNKAFDELNGDFCVLAEMNIEAAQQISEVDLSLYVDRLYEECGR